jgi:Rieske Fe-S protein
MSQSARRSFLKSISGLLAAANAAMVGIPAIWYGVGSLRRQEPSEVALRRVARLEDLPPGRPVLVPIIGELHDAWTLQPSEPIGRAWLIRSATDPTDPTNTSVNALSAICPHLGCTIQLAADSKHYVCPCHRAAFAFDGERVGDVKSGRPNHAPRSMDALECRVVQDEVSKEWWVEVRYEEFEQGLTISTATA